MTRIDAGRYDIYCGPVKLEGADGALARVFSGILQPCGTTRPSKR